LTLFIRSAIHVFSLQNFVMFWRLFWKST